MTFNYTQNDLRSFTTTHKRREFKWEAQTGKKCESKLFVECRHAPAKEQWAMAKSGEETEAFDWLMP